MAELKLYPMSRVKPESTYLQAFRKTITSQCGEDGIIEKAMEILEPTNRYCVEFGAGDGKQLSNTWSLINNHNWSALLIEGNHERFTQLARNYAETKNVHTMNRYVAIDKRSDRLDAILAQAAVPKEFDFLSIDVDGCDWHIWESLTDFHPRLISIEINPSIPNHVYFVQDRDLSVHHGSSLCAMIELGKNKGYELVATTELNAFFVRSEDFPKFNIADNSINAMHASSDAESSFFQLYDGTVVLCGCTRLIWCGVPINNEDIQVLPRALRRFNG